MFYRLAWELDVAITIPRTSIIFVVETAHLPDDIVYLFTVMQEKMALMASCNEAPLFNGSAWETFSILSRL